MAIPLKYHWGSFYFPVATRNRKMGFAYRGGRRKAGGWDRHILSPDFILRNKTLL